jgi:hypothetical protein
VKTDTDDIDVVRALPGNSPSVTVPIECCCLGQRTSENASPLL